MWTCEISPYGALIERLMRNSKSYRYSPLEINRYRLRGVKDDEVSTILSIDKSPAVWNLFWLSQPDLDPLPTAGAKWWAVYTPKLNLLKTVVRDVYDDEVMYRKLTMHPDHFIDWFEREDHEMYDLFDLMDRERWVNTVLKRAESAATRMTLEDPPVVVRDNVVSIFGRRAA